jgi:hypothetical protein
VDISQQRGERLVLVVSEVYRLLACDWLLTAPVSRLLDKRNKRMSKITHFWFWGIEKG